MHFLHDHISAFVRLPPVKKLVSTTIPLYALLLLFFWQIDYPLRESPIGLLAINLLFGTFVSLVLCSFITKKFLLHGDPGLVLFGCGVILWGVAGTAGAIAAMRPSGFDPNITVTIHNTCTWAAGFCHMLNCSWSVRWHLRLIHPRRWIVFAYSMTGAFVAALIFGTTHGYTPTFFIQGKGGTLVRQVILLSGSLCFISSALLIRWSDKRHRNFHHWYSCALLMIGLGLLVLPCISFLGGALNWVVRVGQAVSGVYLLAASACFLEETDPLKITSTAKADKVQGLLLAVAVISGATACQLFLFQMETGTCFVVFFPAVVLVAVYSGCFAGLMATFFSVLSVWYFWLGGLGFTAVPNRDVFSVIIFIISCIILSIGSELLKRLEQLYRDAEIKERIAAGRLAEQMASEEAIRQAHSLLEVRVAERTVELQSALKELENREHLLLQQSRSAAMGEMINNIAHQWRQPLNSLGLMIQQVGIEAEMGSLTKAGVTSIVTKSMTLVKHMSQTIDDFRNFFKPLAESAEFSVGEVIRDALKLLDPSLKHAYIEVVIEERCHAVGNGHGNEFGQAIINIINNAKDALLLRGTSDPLIRIVMSESNGNALITIEDNAGGIDADVLPRVFDPYFSTKAQGTGIGLFMAKNIIEKGMNGRLSVTNTTTGARFTIEFLPVSSTPVIFPDKPMAVAAPIHAENAVLC